MSKKIYIPYKTRNDWAVDFPDRATKKGDINYVATEYVWGELMYEYNCDGERHHEHSFAAALESIVRACINGYAVDIRGYEMQYSRQERTLIAKVIDKITNELKQYNISDISDKIKKETMRSVFRISLEEDQDKQMLFYKSKVGGNPFWKKNMKYPEVNGKPMKMLAQINLKELPPNDIFPKAGMLQFFVAQDDDHLKLNDEARVVFHKDLSDGFEYKVKIDKKYVPILKEGRMKFEKSEEPISLSDISFEKYKQRFSEDLKDVIDEILYDRFDWGDGCKLLGYPYFTQEAPPPLKEYDILLLQLDSDFKFIMYGDVGVGNFFIKSQDLKDMKFDDVYYTWDCH